MVRRSILLTATVSLILACTPDGSSSDDVPTDGGTGGNDSGPADSGTPDGGGGDGGSPDSGPDLTRDPNCQANWVVVVNGQLTTESGAGLSAKAQVCLRTSPGRTQICLRPVDSGADGSFSIEVAETARCAESMVMRAVAPGTTYAASYCQVPLNDTAIETLARPVALYDTVAPAVHPPEGATDQVRTVEYVDGLKIEITPDQYVGDYSMLTSKKIGAQDPPPCFLPQGETFDGVWALGPEGDVMGNGFPVRIPNDTGLAPGTTVDLYVLGGLFCKLPGSNEQLEEGLWEPYGSATVNNTGDFIEGGDIPCFNWFGYQAR